MGLHNIEENPEHPLHQSFINYRAVLKSGGTVSGQPMCAEEHLKSGFGTAHNEMLRIAKLVLLVHRQQLGEIPSSEQYEMILHSSLPTLMSIASSHLNIFLGYESVMDDRERYECDELHHYVRIEWQGDRMRLELTSESISEINMHSPARLKEYRGCPALRVTSDSEKNVIVDMYRSWIIPLAKDFLYPQFVRRAEEGRL